MIKYLFFDTETSGLPKDWKAPISNTLNWPRLVQIAWITTDDSGCILTESEFIIYPSNFTIPTEASNIHGITTDIAINKGVELVMVLQKFNEAIEEANYIVAHNINFDEKIIGAEFYRKNIKTSLLGKERICTMQSSTNYCALPGKYGYKWPSLSELHFKIFGDTFQEAHNALVDIKATHKCFWKLVDNGIILINQRNAPKQTVKKSNQEKITKVNKNHKLEIFDENKEYVEIWKNLPKIWKEQIKPLMPKKKNPDYYFPFDNQYLSSIRQSQERNNQEILFFCD